MSERPLRIEFHRLFRILHAIYGIQPVAYSGNLKPRENVSWIVLNLALKLRDGRVDLAELQQESAIGVVNVCRLWALISELAVFLSRFIRVF